MSRTWTRYVAVMIVTEAYNQLFASVLVCKTSKFFFIKGMASSTEQIVNKSLFTYKYFNTNFCSKFLLYV